MNERAEVLVTLILIAVCVVVGAGSVLPRLLVRQVPIELDSPDITVAVEGAVVAPGLYTLPFRARVADALELAGGLTAHAEASLVNLAAPLGPGDRVFVPDRWSAPEQERVSLNSASNAQLQTLPGVGPAVAQRIIDGRPYTRVEDLLRVKGIGEKTLERLRDFVRL